MIKHACMYDIVDNIAKPHPLHGTLISFSYRLDIDSLAKYHSTTRSFLIRTECSKLTGMLLLFTTVTVTLLLCNVVLAGKF